MALTIKKVYGREILDSRGNPTVEVELRLSDGSEGRAIVPSGASTGKHEALELRDGDPRRFLGKGTLKAVEHINGELSRAINHKSFASVQNLDRVLLTADGTAQKSKLGANAILGVSLAFVHALARAEKRPLFLVLNEQMGLTESGVSLPVPLMNILNGGIHADNGLEIQEFMIVPHGFESFSEALRAGCEVFQHLKKRLHEKKLSTTVGDEGGFAPAVGSTATALDLIEDAIRLAGYDPGKQIAMALDVAASSFYDESEEVYRFRWENRSTIDRAQLIRIYGELLEKYPIVSIEDGLYEDDWEGWRTLTDQFGKKVQLVGDDLFVTQEARVRRGIEEGVANAVLIKVNQVGSLSETFATMSLCRKHDYRQVVSHRSGESEDVTIAHLAVGSGCGQIKTGSVSRSERTAKYNELLRIEEWGAQSGKAIPFSSAFASSVDQHAVR